MAIAAIIIIIIIIVNAFICLALSGRWELQKTASMVGDKNA